MIRLDGFRFPPFSALRDRQEQTFEPHGVVYWYWTIPRNAETLGSSQERRMSDSPDIKDKVAAAAVTGAGATVGGAGGATVGVLELAARGVATGLSATLVIGAAAAAGAALAYGAYRLFRKRKPSRSQNTPGTAS